MGCQSEVILGDGLTFSIATHDPDTGELTDADSAPVYRIYEGETTIPILTGTMAALDVDNTTGFYSERVVSSTVNGFETNESYTVYIEATVDGYTGGISYGFTVTAVLDDIAAADIWAVANRTLTEGTVPTDAVVSGNKITVYRGTTWSIPIESLGEIGDDDILYFTVKAEKSGADVDAKLQLRVGGADPGLLRFNGAETERGDGEIEVLDSVAGNVVVRVDESITANAVPRSLQAPTMHYDFKRVRGGSVEVLAPGTFVVEADITRAVT